MRCSQQLRIGDTHASLTVLSDLQQQLCMSLMVQVVQVACDGTHGNSVCNVQAVASLAGIWQVSCALSQD
jgi:hypothetical protein